MVNIHISQLNQSYDFVIVGGGTAGLVLANRLSENPSVSVLVVEAGEHRPDDSKINTPGLMASLGDDPTYDWMFRTVPQVRNAPTCSQQSAAGTDVLQESLNGRVIGHPRGRVLGGSSALQYGMVVFPSKAGNDAWAELGNPGWSWEEMVPYYQKFHTLSLPSKETIEDLSLAWIDKKLQGSSGPVQVSFASSDFYGPLHKAWTKTFKTLKYETSSDPLTGIMQGAYCNPTTVDSSDKSRSYSASAYYTPEVAKRTNLHVLTKTMVQKITLSGTDGDNNVSAQGIVLIHNGTQNTIVASREVLLCAGTIQSPQILELSGIGGSKLLQPLGIECIVDNPNVGENMQDHAICSVSFEVVDGTPTAEALKQPGVMEAAIAQYKNSRTGPLTSSAICNSYMPLPEYLSTEDSLDRAELARLIRQYAIGPASNGRESQYALLRRILENPDESTVQYHLCAFQLNPGNGPGPSNWLAMREPGSYLTFPANLSHPFSRGSVHVTSSSVEAHPRIDPGYLSNPLDLEVLARHLMFSATIAHTEPMAQYVKEGGRRVPADAQVDTLENAKKLVARTLSSTYYPASTCSMMPRELGGLWIVDSESMA